MIQRSALALCGLSTLLLSACGGGSSGGSGSSMDLVQMSNGFGVMVPYQVHKPDSLGNPTNEIVSIRSIDDLINNVRPANPIVAATELPLTTQLPNGDAGNQFVFLEFSSDLDIDTVLSKSPSGQANSGLTTNIAVIAVDPATNTASLVRGRGFIGGKTYSNKIDPQSAPGAPSLLLEAWVIANNNGKPIANTSIAPIPPSTLPPGRGFPGTQSQTAFNGSDVLLKDSTFVFVADTDGDLATHETFPPNRQLRVQATTAVRSITGRQLVRTALGSTTVGPDTINPEVAQTPTGIPDTIPALGDTDVDPLTNIIVRYTEPVQPLSVGNLPTGLVPIPSPAISVTFGPSTSIVTVPFSVLPISVYDFSTWELTPAFNFPGSGPPGFPCAAFNAVTVAFNSNQVQDMRANLNATAAQTSFETGEGPGLINAPVTPDVIYAIRSGGQTAGISVLDLNGFGQSTGLPTFDPNQIIQGNTHFPYNPNLIIGSQLRPPLAPGVCTTDGGSAGVFTLTRDSSLNDLMLRAPVITTVGDTAIGWALDVVFNNGQESSGCQAGGGNICAIRGKKNIMAAFGIASVGGTLIPTNVPGVQAVGFAVFSQGGGNLVSWAPHPNPPPLVFPPLCIAPFIGGAEPTSWEVIEPPPPVGPTAFGLGLVNLLTPGDPFGNPGTNTRPGGILAKQQNGWFEGPSPVRTLNQCVDYMVRQQVGNFLYVIDQARREVVVLNSNRFTVLDRIAIADPTEFAMSPNLDFLAVTSRDSDSVTFIDIQPASSTFHQVVKVLEVGHGPQGIAWDPGNEDILVCNEFDNSVSIIGVASLAIRKTVSSQLNHPFDVAIQQRNINFGFFRNVYNAFILNRGGDLAIFESGPNGVNGWGYDDIIGEPPFIFESPKRIMLDFNRLEGSIWILHENKLNLDGSQTGIAGGAVTNLVIDSAIPGVLPLNFQSLLIPNFRDMSFRVNVSIGPDELTGVPIDFAMDDLLNLGGSPNQAPVQGAGTPINSNGKSSVRLGGGNVIVPAKAPNFLFLAIPTSTEGPGVIDVIDVSAPGYRRFDTNVYVPGIQSIPASGITSLCDYWRQ